VIGGGFTGLASSVLQQPTSSFLELSSS